MYGRLPPSFFNLCSLADPRREAKFSHLRPRQSALVK